MRYDYTLGILLGLLSSTSCAFLHLHPAKNKHISAVVPQATVRKPSSQQQGRLLRAADDEENMLEELLPETSFGAEAVPEGQRPINEYLDLLRAPLFGWAALESGSQGLITRLAAVYVVLSVVACYPIAGATFTQPGYGVQTLLASNVGALSVLGFLLIRLYSGWGYVGQRLTSKFIEFEETGWYDGDVELKTETERKRDRFLYNDKVKPVVERLKMFSLGLGGLWLASIVAFNTSLSMKPMLNQYDPRMLERLNLDDKLAEKVAENSGGKPIYCDSRYYRAVAGGGQGCD